MQILYGGAFNPPTIAHYYIIKYSLDTFENSTLTILPANNFYYKNSLAPFYHRFKMLKILCDKLDNKRISISDYESKLDKYYGTYYILKAFDHPYFIIGADGLKSLNKWIKFPDVVIENKFIVFPRENIDIEKVFNENEVLFRYKKNFIILKSFRELNVSSTMYRNSFDDKYLLPEVAKYIKENKLYEVN